MHASAAEHDTGSGKLKIALGGAGTFFSCQLTPDHASDSGPAPGEVVSLYWATAMHVPTSLHRVAKDQECDETFLRLLDERAGQGLDVSAHPSVLYAPKVFADMPNNGGFAKRAFTDATRQDRMPPADSSAPAMPVPPMP